jgi:hypothetical protein
VARITRMTKRRLGELLQAEGLVSEDQVRMGLEEQRKSNMFLGEALVKLGFVSEEVIAQTIVQQFSLPFISSNQYNITPDVLNIFPERMYYEYQFIAADKIGRVLMIIGAGLMNHDVLDELERLSGCKVCQFVSTWKDIRASLEKHAKDLRKDQGSLNNLGSMLLDSAVVPIPKLPPAPAAPGSAISTTQRPMAPAGAPVPTPAAATPNNLSSLGTMLLDKPSAAQMPAVAAAAASAQPKPVAPAGPRTPPGPNTLPAAATGKTGLVLSPPKLVTSMNPQAAAKIAGAPSGTAVMPGGPQGPQTARLSALSGVKPPATNTVPMKAPAPDAPKDAAADPKNPPQPSSKTGLLGLFKKP